MAILRALEKIFKTLGLIGIRLKAQRKRGSRVLVDNVLSAVESNLGRDEDAGGSSAARNHAKHAPI